MRIPYSNNLAKDIIKLSGLAEEDVYPKDINYVIPNISALDELLAFNTNIVIFSDCDTDGLCAAAICKIYFSTFEGYNVSFAFSSRDSRGFTETDVLRILDKFPETTAILTVDCGITSVSAVELAKLHGIDVLVTDHHEPQADLPDCAIINPKLDNRDVFKEFCGAGLIYLAFRQLEGDNEYAAQYAAIATVADVMPLVNDNRYIVKRGLELIYRNPDPTLKSFLSGSKINVRTAKDIGWSIGPLINSASRLGKEDIAFKSLVFGDKDAIKELLEINKDRKKIVEKIMEKADNITLTAHAASIYSEEDHVGLLGLLAIKLYSEFGLASIAYCTTEDGKTHFSIRGENVIDFLSSLADENIEGGGHDSAAGFSISGGNVTSGQQIVCQFYEWNERLYSQRSRNDSLGTVAGSNVSKTYDSISIGFGAIVDKIGIKNRLEPYGFGFNDPIFYSDNIIIKHNGRTTSDKYNRYLVCGKDAEVVFYDFNEIINPSLLNKPVSIEYNIGYSSFNNKPVVEILKVFS